MLAIQGHTLVDSWLPLIVLYYGFEEALSDFRIILSSSALTRKRAEGPCCVLSSMASSGVFLIIDTDSSVGLAAVFNTIILFVAFLNSGKSVRWWNVPA